MKKLLKNRSNRITLLFFIITMVTAVSPLISRYCINGHDLEYHLLRIESLKEGILIGHPFMKVNTLFYGGAGYASTLFYSDLFMHIPALLRVLHVGIGKSFHIYTAMIFVLCYLSAFYCAFKMTKSKFAGTVAAILLTLCPYHIDDMLVRTACGENAAFIFLPFVIYGIYNVLFEDMDRPWIFGLGFAGLIVTHPATCILAFVFALFVFLINIRAFIRQPWLFAKICIVSALAVLVTSYQWLPMLEQFASAGFYVSKNWTDLLDSAVNFSTVASGAFPGMGFMLFALAIPRVFLSRKDYPILSYVDLMLVAAFAFAAGATNIMPWERVAAYFGFLQFPWRLFAISSVLLAMADAVIAKLFINRIEDGRRNTAFEISLTLITIVMAGGAIAHQNANSMGYYDYSDDYYSHKPFTGGVIAGEGLPTTVTEPDKLIEQSDKMVYDDGTKADFTREKGSIISDIKPGHQYVDVPFIYYKGYRAYLTDAEGAVTKPEVTGEGTNGMCRVMLEGAGGRLAVSYGGTILQYVSLVVSHLFVILIFDLWYLKNKYRKKLKSRAAAAGANPGMIACLALIAAASLLSGCSVQIGNGGNKSDARFTDPEDVIDYLKVKNNVPDDTEEIEALVKVNFSQRGYDTEGKSYAVVIDERTGEQVISLVSLEDAKENTSEIIPVIPGFYGQLLREEVRSVREKYRTDSMQDRIMNATDALLCMEVFPQTATGYGVDELAVLLSDDLLDIPEDAADDIRDKYACSAVLAKAAYVIGNWERAQNATDLSEQYFKEAELMAGSGDEPVATRMWAAAELYRLTGLKTYRSVVDAIAMDTVPEGFTYEDPGFFGVFAYLMTENDTNRNVCNSMMDVAFSRSNELIKIPIEEQFYDTRLDDTTYTKDEKTARIMLDEAELATMTDYVSVSVEYKDFVQDRLSFIFGANLSGVDFTGEDEALCDTPRLFVLAGQCQ